MMRSIVTLAGTYHEKPRAMGLCGPERHILFRARAVDHGTTDAVRGEPVRSLSAREILPPHRIRGRHYSVDSEVRVIDYDYYFRVKTDYGTMPAHSMNMLKLRLEEMAALRNAERLSREAHVVEGVSEAVRSTARGAEMLLTEPLTAARRTPTGLGRMARSAVDMADLRSGDATRRELAARIGCDPETTNPILAVFLTQMSVRQLAGGELVDVAAMPYTGVFDLTADIERIVREQPPHEVNDQISAELQRRGVARYVADRFVRNQRFTTMQRLLFMEAYRPLAEITGHESLVHFAMESSSEAEALNAIAAAESYGEINRRTPIARFRTIGIPVATVGDGTDVMYCAADFLTATHEVEEAIAAYRRSAPDAGCRFIVSGRVSAQALELFAAADIRVEAGTGRMAN